MKKINYSRKGLNDLYGDSDSGPIVKGEINWKEIAINGGIALSVTVVFCFGIHLAIKHNASTWILQTKQMHDSNKQMLDKINSLSQEIEKIKSNQSSANQANRIISEDTNQA